jgi:flagellar hook-basal body complex protein FliE
MASPTVAANAYASLARMMDSGGAGKGSKAGGGPSFGALLKDAIGSVMDAGKNPTRRQSRWRRARPM